MDTLIKVADDFKKLWGRFDDDIFSDAEIDKIRNKLIFKSIKKENYNKNENKS